MTDVRHTAEPLDLQQPGTSSESVFLLERFQAGDEAAATALFERFSSRLAALVQNRLSKKLARRLDAEDIVLSAYRSFFVRARDGQFAVSDTGDLWRLLAQITLNKLCRSADWHSAAKRDFAREQSDAAGLANLTVANSDSPDLEVVVADQLERLMSQLPVATCRVLELLLQGYAVGDIAETIGRTPRTVRRQLETIRALFTKQSGAEVSSNDNGRISTPTSNSTVRHRTLTEFVLRRQIGYGLTGRVYEAFDKQQQRLVAVKVLRKSWLTDRALRERFEAEAEVVARLNHSGIVRVHGHGATPNDGWFLVMDLLSNGDLTPFAGLSLPVAQATDWIRQVALAVDHAHRQGVIHCDLKPANLLLADDQRVIVTDFGFAQLRDQTARRNLAIAGTPAFMAPEQIDPNLGAVSPQTDIYGLGTVLHFLLTGQPPVPGSRVRDVFDEITSPQEIAPITTLRSDVPGQLANLCARCLRKSPQDRFVAMSDVIESLS